MWAVRVLDDTCIRGVFLLLLVVTGFFFFFVDLGGMTMLPGWILPD